MEAQSTRWKRRRNPKVRGGSDGAAPQKDGLHRVRPLRTLFLIVEKGPALPPAVVPEVRENMMHSVKGCRQVDQ